MNAFEQRGSLETRWKLIKTDENTVMLYSFTYTENKHKCHGDRRKCCKGNKPYKNVAIFSEWLPSDVEHLKLSEGSERY